jgi:hypothetical protein
MPYGATRTRMARTPELAQAEREGQELLHKYCRAQVRNQKRLAESTGLLASVISRLSNFDGRISLEAAILFDLATDGELAAEKLCPSRAGLLDEFIKSRSTSKCDAA